VIHIQAPTLFSSISKALNLGQKNQELSRLHENKYHISVMKANLINTNISRKVALMHNAQ